MLRSKNAVSDNPTAFELVAHASPICAPGKRLRGRAHSAQLEAACFSFDGATGRQRLSAWLEVVFAYQLPRKLHRWLAWAEQQADMLRSCPAIVIVALSRLRPHVLLQHGDGRIDDAHAADLVAALRSDIAAGSAADEAGARQRQAQMCALFAQLDVEHQLCFCAGVLVLRMCARLHSCAIPALRVWARPWQ